MDGGNNFTYDATSQASNDEIIAWRASEYVNHDKNSGWYLILAFVGLVLVVITYFITGQDWFSSVVIAVLLVVFGITATKKAKEIDFSLDYEGVQVDGKSYSYEQFRAFAIIDDGQMESVYLLPVKRFNVPLTLYFAPEDADRIIAFLENVLPYEDRQMSVIDKFMHRIKF